MTRLVGAELRKIWHSRFFLLAFTVLLGANLFLLWFGTGRTPGNVPAAAYRTLEETLAGQSMEEMDAFLHGELHRAEAVSYTHLLALYSIPPIPFACRLPSLFCWAFSVTAASRPAPTCGPPAI